MNFCFVSFDASSFFFCLRADLTEWFCLACALRRSRSSSVSACAGFTPRWKLLFWDEGVAWSRLFGFDEAV